MSHITKEYEKGKHRDHSCVKATGNFTEGKLSTSFNALSFLTVAAGSKDQRWWSSSMFGPQVYWWDVTFIYCWREKNRRHKERWRILGRIRTKYFPACLLILHYYSSKHFYPLMHKRTSSEKDWHNLPFLEMRGDPLQSHSTAKKRFIPVTHEEQKGGSFQMASLDGLTWQGVANAIAQSILLPLSLSTKLQILQVLPYSILSMNNEPFRGCRNKFVMLPLVFILLLIPQCSLIDKKR